MNESLNEFREKYLNDLNDETLNKEMELINQNLTNDNIEYVLLTEMAMINSIFNMIKQYTEENNTTEETLLKTIQWLKDRFTILKDYYEKYIIAIVKYLTDIQQEEKVNDE